MNEMMKDLKERYVIYQCIEDMIKALYRKKKKKMMILLQRKDNIVRKRGEDKFMVEYCFG